MSDELDQLPPAEVGRTARERNPGACSPPPSAAEGES